MEIHNLFSMFPTSITPDVIVAYIGPDVIMPLLSILAAIVGALLIMWRNVLAFTRKCFRRVRSVFNRDADIEL